MVLRLSLLAVFILIFGCGNGEDIQPIDKPTNQYPGAPIITIKKTSFENWKDGRLKLIYRLESIEALPYNIKVRMEASGKFAAQGKEFEWEFPHGFWIHMKAGTFVKQQSITGQLDNIGFEFNDIGYEAVGWSKLKIQHKTLSFVLVPWEHTKSKTGDDPYNLGNPSHLTIKL